MGEIQRDGSSQIKVAVIPPKGSKIFDENDFVIDAKSASFIADNTTNTFTSVGHGLNNDDVVKLSSVGGALPAELDSAAEYYVVNKTDDTFQLSLVPTTSPSVTPVLFSDNGTGVHKFTKIAHEIALGFATENILIVNRSEVGVLKVFTQYYENGNATWNKRGFPLEKKYQHYTRNIRQTSIRLHGSASGMAWTMDASQE